MTVQLLVLTGFFCVCLFVVYRAPAVAFAALAGLVSANGIFVDTGVSVSASRVLTIAFLPWALMRAASRGPSLLPAGITTLVAVLSAYALAVTSSSFFLFLPPIAGMLGETRESSRWLIQWASFSLSIMPILIGPMALRTSEDALSAFRAFIYGVSIMCAFAIIQWLSAQFLGVPILGITRGGLFSGDIEGSFFLAGDLQIQRANGFSREPKDLAAASAIALVSVAIFGMPGLRGSRQRLAIVASLLTAGLVVSFSTTGVVLLGVGLFFVALAYMQSPASREGLVNSRFRVYALVVIAVILIAGSTVSSDYWSTIVDERVTSRVGDVEEYDQVALDFLLDKPLVLVTGIGAGLLPFYANDYVPNDPILLEYMLNYTWDAKAGALKWIASFGALGCAIAGLVLYRVISATSRLPKANSIITRRTAVLFIGFLTTVQAIRTIDEIYWVLVGTVLAFASASLRQAATVATSVARPGSIQSVLAH